MKQCMDADNLHRRLKKIIGQVQAIDRMVDEDVPCEDILSQINAAKSALNGCGKVVLEGHIHYPEQAVKALEAGAFALVVGGAITRPAEITARFTGAINAAKK